MKSYFIIDTTCGGGKKIEKFFEQIAKIKEKYKEEVQLIKIIDSKLITPTCANLSKNITTPTLVICCGGESSLNLVINGLKENPNVIFSLYPMGISNDFLVSFNRYSNNRDSNNYDFTNIENVLNGEDIKIDLLDVNGKYSYNVTNIGFDSLINHELESSLKNKKFSYAFYKSIIKNLITYKAQRLLIKCDDQEIYDGHVLLSVFGNGVCYGKGYLCTPEANIQDGLIDVFILKRVSIIRRIFLLKKFQKGLLYRYKSSKVISLQSKKVEIMTYGSNNFYVCLDGRDFSSNHITINILPSSINLRVPKIIKK